MQRPGSLSLVDRMMGVARLDVPIYEEIERDKNATTQAFLVVVIASVAAGIGTLNSDGLSGLIVGLLAAVISWVIYSVTVYLVGTRLLATSATEADSGQLLRTLGFANAPRVLYVFGFIPLLGWIVVVVAGIWSVVTSVIAIRQSLEMSTGRAIATGLVSLIPAGLITGLIYWIFNISAPGGT
jgi:hypothetical protein